MATQSINKTPIVLIVYICLPILFLSVQCIFNSLTFAFGNNYWNIAFMDRGDLFGDFLKYNPAFQIDTANISELIASVSDSFSQKYYSYLTSPAYGNSIDEIADKTTIFTSPSLSILISLVIANVVVSTSPLITFILVVSLCSFSILYAIRVMTKNSLPILIAGIIQINFLLSYPFLFSVSKGNYLSLITSTFAILAFAFAARSRKLFASILISSAIIMRPNLLPLILLLPITFLHDPQALQAKKLVHKSIPYKKYLRHLSLLITVFITVFGLSTLFAYQINSDFNLYNFYSAYKLYDKWYIHGSGGLAFGSSLFGSIKSLLIIISKDINIDRNSINLIKLLTYSSGLLISIASIIGYLKGKITYASLSFLIVSSILLSTPVFADYHLLIFYIPLLSLFSAEYENQSVNFYTVLLASNILISPFTYYWRFDEFAFASSSVLLRPLICSIFVLVLLKHIFFKKVPTPLSPTLF